MVSIVNIYIYTMPFGVDQPMHC